MKFALAALLVLPAVLGSGASEVLAPTRPDDPPLDCPLCGMDARIHARILSATTSLNARASLRVLAAFYG